MTKKSPAPRRGSAATKSEAGRRLPSTDPRTGWWLFALVVGISALALAASLRHAPLGVPVADDYAFLDRWAFQRPLDPFDSMGAGTVVAGRTGGTDHVYLQAIGVPGFQFIQDPVEYGTRTHHSNMDTYERVQEADMKLNSAVIASFVYHAANRPGLFPRKMPVTP